MNLAERLDDLALADTLCLITNNYYYCAIEKYLSHVKCRPSDRQLI